MSRKSDFFAGLDGKFKKYDEEQAEKQDQTAEEEILHTHDAKKESYESSKRDRTFDEKMRDQDRDREYTINKEWEKHTQGDKEEEKDATDPFLEARKRLDEAAEKYATSYGEEQASLKWYQKIIGKNIEGFESVGLARRAYLEALKDYKRAYIAKTKFKGKQEDLDTIVNEMLVGELAKVKSLKEDEIKSHNEKKGWWSKNVVNGYMGILKGWESIDWKARVGFSVAMVGTGVALTFAGISLAGIPLAIFLALKAGQRIIGAGMSGKGTHMLLESITDKWRVSRHKKEMKEAAGLMKEGNLEQKADRVDAWLDAKIDGLDQKLVSQGRWSGIRKKTALYTGILVGSGGLFLDVCKTWGLFGFGNTVAGASQHSPTTGAPSPEGKGFKFPLATEGKGGAVQPEVASGGKAGVPAPDTAPGGKHVNVAPGHSGEVRVPAEQLEKPRIHSQPIESGTKLNNSWAATRQVYMDHAKEYGYDPNNPNLQARMEKWFHSYKDKGILGRLGIHADNYADMTEAEKLKMWSEHETAEAIRKFKVINGGRSMPSLVHAGDKVTVYPDNVVKFSPDSGIKAVHLHHATGHGAGRAAADSYGAVDTSEYDQRIAEARRRGILAGERQQHFHNEQIKAEADYNYQKSFDPARTGRLMKHIFENDYSNMKAKEFVDQMQGPVRADNYAPTWQEVEKASMKKKIAKSMIRRLGTPTGTVKDWAINKLSPEEFMKMRKASGF